MHGFLGLASDWEATYSALDESIKTKHHFNFLHYVQIPELSPNNELSVWGGNFNRYILGIKPLEKDSHGRAEVAQVRRVLIGYSMGGRLALHALNQNPELWDQVICLSSNPFGLNAKGRRHDNLAEIRQSRADLDAKWALRFMHEEFSTVINEWNGQTVFQGSKNEPVRLKQNYKMSDLAAALTNWSLAKQENFGETLSKEAKAKITLIAGLQDSKYVQFVEDWNKILNELSLSSANTHILPNCGHRVLFDCPSWLQKLLDLFGDLSRL